MNSIENIDDDSNVSWYEDVSIIFENVKSHHVLVIVVVIAVVALFHYRHKIAQWHDRYRTRTRYQGIGFQLDIENGLTSSNFDLHSNISSGDSREGLSENATREIRTIMRNQNKSFDEARLIHFRLELEHNGIGSDGVPTDSRTVTLS